MGMWAELWEVTLSQRCWKDRKDWLLHACRYHLFQREVVKSCQGAYNL